MTLTPHSLTDIKTIANHNPADPTDLRRAERAMKALILNTSTQHRALILEFIQGKRHGLGVNAPMWLYKVAGILYQRYLPQMQVGQGKQLATLVLDILRSRLVILLGIKRGVK